MGGESATTAGESGVAAGGATLGNGGEAAASAGAPAAGGEAGNGDGAIGGEAGVSGPAPVPGGEAGDAAVTTLTDLAISYCATAVACCHGPFADVGDCLVHVLSERTPLRSIATGARRLDSARVAACRAAVETSANDCMPIPAHVCEGLYVPASRPGEGCFDGSDCVTGDGSAACFIDGSESSLTSALCTALTRGREGDACAGTCTTGKDCSVTVYNAHDAAATVCLESDALWCDPGAFGGPVCEHTVAEGDFCFDDTSCGPGAICYYDPMTQPDTYCITGGFGPSCDCESGFTCEGSGCRRWKNFEESLDCYGIFFEDNSPEFHPF